MITKERMFFQFRVLEAVPAEKYVGPPGESGETPQCYDEAVVHQVGSLTRSPAPGFFQDEKILICLKGKSMILRTLFSSVPSSSSLLVSVSSSEGL